MAPLLNVRAPEGAGLGLVVWAGHRPGLGQMAPEESPLCSSVPEVWHREGSSGTSWFALGTFRLLLLLLLSGLELYLGLHSSVKRAVVAFQARAVWQSWRCSLRTGATEPLPTATWCLCC